VVGNIRERRKQRNLPVVLRFWDAQRKRSSAEKSISAAQKDVDLAVPLDDVSSDHGDIC
jgi:hypothetical protein